MKGRSGNSEAVNTPPPQSASSVDSDDDLSSKLVIDLDCNAVSPEKCSPTKKVNPPPNLDIPTEESSLPSTDTNTSPDAENVHTFVKPEPRSPGGTANGTNKTKGKRGGRQAKKTDNANANKKNEKVAPASKPSKGEKPVEETNSSTKPARKRKPKVSEIKMEPDTTAANGQDADPYNFDKNEDKSAVSATSYTMKANTSSNTVRRDAATDYDLRSVGLITEPETLGACEPGTQVCLEGIVWQETNNGVLVVNVTWKGKTYMGTLIDSTRHDWSPPFRNDCDTPCGELDGRTPKGRSKRSRVPLSDTFKDINERKMRKELRKASAKKESAPSPAKSDSNTSAGKRRSNRPSEGENEPTPKRGRRSAATAAPPSPTVLVCPEPNCNKKYKKSKALEYHRTNAHQNWKGEEAVDSASEETVVEPIVKKARRKASKNAAANMKQQQATEQTTDTESNEGNNDDSSGSTATVPTSSSGIPSIPSVPTETPVSTANSPIESCQSKPSQNVTGSQTQITSTASLSTYVVSSTVGQSPLDKARAVSLSASPSMPGTSKSSFPMTVSPSQKILPKGVVTSAPQMAPISTITTHGITNPALKPIQPKPTILGETAAPNPALSDLRDQKRFNKRKRSASKEDLTNGTGLKPEGGLLTVPSNPSLQSPPYSDISDDSQSERLRPSVLGNPVATVNPNNKPVRGGCEPNSVTPKPNIIPDLRQKMDEEIRRQFPESSNESISPRKTNVTSSTHSSSHNSHEQMRNGSLPSSSAAIGPPGRNNMDRLQLIRESERQRDSPKDLSIPQMDRTDRKRSPTPRTPPTTGATSSHRVENPSSRASPRLPGHYPGMIPNTFNPFGMMTSSGLMFPQAMRLPSFPFSPQFAGLQDMKDGHPPPGLNFPSPRPSSHKIHELENGTASRGGNMSDRMMHPPSGSSKPANSNPQMAMPPPGMREVASHMAAMWGAGLPIDEFSAANIQSMMQQRK